MLQKFKFLFVFFLSFCFLEASSQDPLRFEKEVKALSQIDHAISNSDKVYLFVGSSSIRMWKNLDEYFPTKKCINNGFGGSHMNDLLFYANDLIFPFEPEVIFIYEGDNDVAAGVDKKNIMKSTKILLKGIKKKYGKIPVVIIAAKPSPSRWKFEKAYLDLNDAFQKYTLKKAYLYYADVWKVMLNNEGVPMPEIFVSDELHMNADGYVLWGRVLNDVLKKIEKDQ